jgi:hypothetical protein
MGPKSKGHYRLSNRQIPKSLDLLSYFVLAVASRKGIEPLTPGLGNLCSILLSYRD